MKFFPVVLLFLLSACAAPAKLLQQTWKMDDVQFIDSLNTFTAEQKMNITSSLKQNFVISFKADSVYAAIHLNKNIPGKWWFGKNARTLYTSNTVNGTMVSKIYELNKARLKFETTNEEKQTFIYTFSPKP